MRFGSSAAPYMNSQAVPKYCEGSLIGGVVANEDRQGIIGNPLEEPLGGVTLSSNGLGKQLPDASSLQQAQARPEMITGGPQDLLGAPRRRLLGSAVMDSQRIPLVFYPNAGQSGEVLSEPDLGLAQELLLLGRKRAPRFSQPCRPSRRTPGIFTRRRRSANLRPLMM